MDRVFISAIVAAVVAGMVLMVGGVLENSGADTDTESEAAAVALSEPALPSGLSYTDTLPEDTWVNAARTAGSDRRSLSNATNSICYLTKVEIKGVQGPEDSNSCVIEIDEFTGFWELVATVEEGGQSEVRCNARCLSWE